MPIVSSPILLTVSQTWFSSGSWAAPQNLYAPPRVRAWGFGGTGANAQANNHSGSGAGGGSYGEEPALGGVTPGSTTLTITFGASSNTVTGGSVAVTGNGGGNGSGASTPGAGGAASGNTIAYAGGSGSVGQNGTGSHAGGAGGGGAGSGGAGSGSSGGTPDGGAGGTAGAFGGGAGGTGGSIGGGGGGGGSSSSVGASGGSGDPGQITITWVISIPAPGSPVIQYRPARKRAPYAQGSPGSPVPGPPVPPAPYQDSPARQLRPARKPPAVAHGAPGILTPTIPGPPVPPPPKAQGPIRQIRPGRRYPSVRGKPGIWTLTPVSVVNQWCGTFAQPGAFGSMPPALQSTVLALTPATSCGGGTGTPTAGNWLFCVAGWNQAGLAAATVGDGDDIHSFWRPGTTSPQAGNTRCSVWYTPNLARQPGDVYVAPSGAVAGMAVLVIEVHGLGPWDTVTGVYSNYAAAATALSLSLGTPSAAAFLVGAVCGDQSGAVQSFAPPGWAALTTVTASNGADHTCDAVLTSACLATNASAVASASTVLASDLSGVIIGVLQQAPSPIPGGWNPAWPYLQFEAAFGGGYETPPDQLTWTHLPNRAWSWNETTGVQYQLGQLQATAGSFQADNYDGALSPSNAGSPWYGSVTTGLPVRLRCALGPPYNRWYVISRNALKWSERRTQALRSYVETTLTDLWSAASRSCPSPYRAEQAQDNPYARWTCDDQALTGGVLPTSLRNSAPGNTNALQILLSPNGAYSSVTADTGGGSHPIPAGATYQVAAMSGWMYGDPASSAGVSPSGGPVTQQPGSAAWQQTGVNGFAGNVGWYLACRDPGFPSLASGASVEGWWYYPFFGTTTASGGGAVGPLLTGQPDSPLTLLELATDTAPVAILQMDITGHLSLTTFNGATGTVHNIYSAGDLRNQGWLHVTITTNGNTWTVYVNGGLTATITGTGAGMTSAWTWLLANADMGAGGGGNTAGIGHIGNLAVSHLTVYPSVLPPWRIWSHYGAAVTGFGAIPAPKTVALQNIAINAALPDGSGLQTGGHFGANASSYTFAAIVTATLGAYTSGPSAEAFAAFPGSGQYNSQGQEPWVTWTGLAAAYNVYTASVPQQEKYATATINTYQGFTSGYGSGASPPAAGSAFGDQVGQRIERLLGYGLITAPRRCIDPAPALVQAALDTAGKQAGAGIQAIADSDNGLPSVDNVGNFCYRQRPHLAADAAVWQLGPNTAAGQHPYMPDITFGNDPQRIFTAVTVTPYSPGGASLPVVTPVNAAGVAAALAQFGPRPLTVTSYLQSQALQQSQANWLFATFGSLARRVEVLTVDAAKHPGAWVFVLGANVGDVVYVADQPFGPPVTAGYYRISNLTRRISYGANRGQVIGSLTIIADPIPASYWT